MYMPIQTNETVDFLGTKNELINMKCVLIESKMRVRKTIKAIFSFGQFIVPHAYTEKRVIL